MYGETMCHCCRRPVCLSLFDDLASSVGVSSLKKMVVLDAE